MRSELITPRPERVVHGVVRDQTSNRKTGPQAENKKYSAPGPKEAQDGKLD